jgi:hypothetical protein
MKHLYLCLLVISLGPLTLAQNRNPQNPALRPRQNNAMTPAMKPAHRTPGAAPLHHNAVGNAGTAPARNGTDAQLAALERQQATGHNPKPAPKKNAVVAAGKVNNPAAGANKPMNFNYKAPNVNNTPVGGNANGRGKH